MLSKPVSHSVRLFVPFLKLLNRFRLIVVLGEEVRIKVVVLIQFLSGLFY
jgi:hypothetical protein